MSAMDVYRAASHSVTGANKRLRLSYADEHDRSGTPAPAYTDTGLRRTKSSIPVRIVRRLTGKHAESFDPNTVPLLSKREQRRAERREQKKLEELQAYQRKQFHDQISRQLEVGQADRDTRLQRGARRSVKQTVKDTIRKTRRSTRNSAQSAPNLQATGPASPAPSHPPHLDEFHDKTQLQQWFHGPADVEATPPPAITIPEAFPAELDATAATSPYYENNRIPKARFDGSLDGTTLPRLARSPSPCLSSQLRRGMTINEIPAPLLSKQMQCDSCHDAIKMTGFHYACNTCNSGDCLYCAKCAHGGRTCRHDLVERTRNIHRHPSNPQAMQRKSLSLDRDSVISADAHLELCATHPHSIVPPLNTDVAEASNAPSSSKAIQEVMNSSPVSATSPVEMLKDFEAKRREQEIAYREKEVTLREREAMLREREAWTASRERDAALVQQLHATAMLQQRAEVGSQFSPVSPPTRQASYYCATSRQSSCGSCSAPASRGSSFFRRPSSSYTYESDGLSLRSSMKGKQPKIELAPSVAQLEASIAGVETVDGIRSHANSTKRKATSESKTTSSAPASKNSSTSSRRTSARREERQDPDDENESESGSPKRRKQDSTTDGEPQKLFACPYYKHDPIRYAEGNTTEMYYRSCAGGLYRDISRVKQHLKRVHHRPDFYCRRCFDAFADNEALQRHSSSRKGCDVKECPFPERLAETQQARIHVKKPGKDPKELWFEIFSIVFPDAPLPDSPYIEQSGKSDVAEVLIQFINSFNSKLTLASQMSQGWLASASVRHHLNEQMLATMREMTQNQALTSPRSLSADVPSVMVSPMSPAASQQHFPGQSRHSSQASRASSNASQHRHNPFSNRMPVQDARAQAAQGGLRPALKVTTSMPSRTRMDSSQRQSNSARSQRNQSFPNVPRHVLEDPGYGVGDSWASGDDVGMMCDDSTNASQFEPSSASSARSNKSVRWATPPQQSQNWQDPEQFHPSYTAAAEQVPDFFDIANLDWSARNFAYDVSDQQSMAKGKSPRRADSAYGTLSSAQNSRTSLFAPQPYMHVSQEQLTCVDPAKLFMNPTEHGEEHYGLSADVRAYLNRNMSGFPRVL